MEKKLPCLINKHSYSNKTYMRKQDRGSDDLSLKVFQESQLIKLNLNASTKHPIWDLNEVVILGQEII